MNLFRTSVCTFSQTKKILKICADCFRHSEAKKRNLLLQLKKYFILIFLPSLRKLVKIKKYIESKQSFFLYEGCCVNPNFSLNFSCTGFTQKMFVCLYIFFKWHKTPQGRFFDIKVNGQGNLSINLTFSIYLLFFLSFLYFQCKLSFLVSFLSAIKYRVLVFNAFTFYCSFQLLLFYPLGQVGKWQFWLMV